ncbi:U32 family peptidase [Kangiella sediminilitoris]|uniref:Ubiquinone biosynthesis protein UbiV n=1 Tax=Kangiella sediminilitoris TaxID=1144748 RepID=A0A1B3BBI0_9GAMM|nr:U32 family peptidase [Kangiella sediminilitoris]AOE50132.1 Peptidase U32 [Kangiella sediminilitoris]
MKTSLASVPYYWSKEEYQNFYAEVAQTEIDIVYLGETVCSKRRSMKLQDWLYVADNLSSAGKEVYLSTLSLMEAESELSYLRNLVKKSELPIEANDMSAIQIANTFKRSFAAGNPINIYNSQTLKRLHSLGMNRWNIPVELGREDIAPVTPKAKELGIELEYQVFGRMPLAYSARCFTARHHNLPKDNCQFKCSEDIEGILVNTREGDSFAQINGIQTQSAKVSNLLNHWQNLEQNGIDIARIVPVSPPDTIEVVNCLTQAIRNNNKKAGFEPHDNEKSRREYCNGYWFQLAGLEMVEAT